MARKPPVKAAAPKAAGKALTNWKEQLGALADEAVETEKNAGGGGRPTLGTRGGVFAYNDEELGRTLEVVVLHHVLENKLYDEGYDPDSPSVPICYAVSSKEDDLAPHAEASDPQSDLCKGCPHNEFGTANTGRGKACKNTRRLALMLAEDLDDIEAAEIVYLNIPVTSTGAWGKYVKSLKANLDLPPVGVVTEITMRPDAKTQFKMEFKVVAEVEEEHYEALFARREPVVEDIMYTYPKPEELEERRPSKAAAKKTPNKKPPVRRR